MLYEAAMKPQNTGILQAADVATGKRKKKVSILELLHWAFQKECAGLTFNGYLSNSHHVSNFGTIYMMMQQAQLGVRVDSSSGRTHTHDDAELVADALVALADRGMAITIADLARSGRCPDWMPGAVPKYMPRAWGRANRYGRQAKTEIIGKTYIPKRGRMVKVDILCCPVVLSPTQSQIASARRDYLRWWGSLLDLSASFQIHGGLTCHEVTNVMPLRTPWKKDVDFEILVG